MFLFVATCHCLTCPTLPLLSVFQVHLSFCEVVNVFVSSIFMVSFSLSQFLAKLYHNSSGLLVVLIKVRLRGSAWHSYQLCVRTCLLY